MNVLVSVTNRDGLVDFFRNAGGSSIQVYASSGSANFLREHGIDSIDISTLTGFSDLLGGRVKTLHPAIFSGILARNTEKDMNEIRRLNYPPFDVVICNLYDFKGNMNMGTERMIENIDIGGVSLIRAAAKNWSRVAVLTNIEDYPRVSSEILENGEVSEETRKNLAIRAFELTSSYDSMIRDALSGQNPGETEGAVINLGNGKKLRYGENPDQSGYLYEVPEYGKLEIFHGKEMSYNNYMDASSAIETALEFNEPFAVVIKHNTPCGAATGNNHEEALEKAINADRESAYGSVICVNGTIDERVASKIKDLFVEVIIGNDFTDGARRMLEKKKNLRMATYSGKGPSSKIRTVFNGFLQQDVVPASPEKIETVYKKDEFDESDLLFAWKIVAHCRSNAIVLAKDGATAGIGAGQTSRVQAAKIAVERAGERASGSIMASDAYLPFSDNVDVAASAGIKAIIQPGGSIRDQEVIETCRKYGISLYFTGKRVFLH
ncbi:MAG: bifunctional phosphoribosylaminoimidazolecarboxamide formyltransferase/IMP cyclohydrolase [Candidatus Thermoplasmatota archaeon]|jgi:phosphoribosylaminoimidazolecarboxamide formyltransferase/IMP cyclohydrolase|nr:bifunctional phosphoribosylaminoimidazolecarboxamide formyltransferase/IMP cyclohydrolase [Candidatus Thermoplasmatota archaeon]MCL5791056.1 bifunctional phosphoribosylaminoimidazolecarboxamide formyltransferase/IMP cyclohydrolase [Candidatus Thermoplasmatota archaeon]